MLDRVCVYAYERRTKTVSLLNFLSLPFSLFFSAYLCFLMLFRIDNIKNGVWDSVYRLLSGLSEIRNLSADMIFSLSLNRVNTDEKTIYR